MVQRDPFFTSGQNGQKSSESNGNCCHLKTGSQRPPYHTRARARSDRLWKKFHNRFPTYHTRGLLEPAAKERQKQGKSADGKSGGRGKRKLSDENLSANLHEGNGTTQHRAADEAAALLNVSPRAVYQAEAVHKHGSQELQQAVERRRDPVV